jgi:hypothetical protein
MHRSAYWRIRGLLLAIVMSLLSACGTTASNIYCPPFKNYTPAQQESLADELFTTENIPTIELFLIDYEELRGDIRACNK